MAGLASRVDETLRALGVRAEKRRGQNFMIDPAALDAVADALGEGGAAVEVGPGLGFLTERLLDRGRSVTAVEMDRVFAPYLQKRFAGRPFRIVEKDVLECGPSRDLGLDAPCALFGNIPYNITSALLEWLIEHRSWFPRAALTVQKEVAARLGARPGGKQWGALSIFVQVHASVEVLRVIGRSAFRPSPEVDSALVRLEFSPRLRADVGDPAVFSAAVRRAFQKRRKTLLNALLPDNREEFVSEERLRAAFAETRIDPVRRPETLTLDEWAALSRSLKRP